jgi:hypothetical protein
MFVCLYDVRSSGRGNGNTASAAMNNKNRREDTMNQLISLLAALAILAAGGLSPAMAEDALKLTIGQRGNWDTSVSEIG